MTGAIGLDPGGTALLGMSRAATTCWECEARMDVSIVVTLHTPVRQLGTLTLCPACYHAAYRPLAQDGSRALLLETGDAVHRLR